MTTALTIFKEPAALRSGMARVLASDSPWRALMQRGDVRRIPLPDKSVDMVITSPPYEDRRSYGMGFSLKGAAWVEWALVSFMECLRVSRGPVCWVVEGKTDDYRWSATPALLMADLHRAGVHLRKPPVYQRYGIPGSGGKDWLRNDYEFIICATPPGRLAWSNPVACGHPPKWAPGGEMSHRLSDGSRRNQWGGKNANFGNRRPNGVRQSKPVPSHVMYTKRDLLEPEAPAPEFRVNERTKSGERRMMRSTNGTKNGDLAPNRRSPFPVLANPGNVIRCKVGGNLMGSKLCHENEAPFPEELVKMLLLTWCKPGGVVLDPMCGSGTVLDVALQHGRRALGMDMRASQIRLSERRLIARLSKETAA